MKLVNLMERLNCIRQLAKYRVIYGKKIEFADTVFVRKNFTVNIDKDAKIIIGRDVFFNNGCSLNAKELITIGDNCLFGEGVKIYDHNHIYTDRNVPIRNQGFKSRTVTIGSNCWIASNVVILPGSNIGNHCVIGANCVIHGVIKDDTLLMNCGNMEQKAIS